MYEYMLCGMYDVCGMWYVCDIDCVVCMM